MAKSKSGGTRTYLRGRVGSDVYSIGKDASGKKQQVVRSLAETVANPQTQAQMRGRMILSTLSQASAGLRVIIDHSFDNVSGIQANLSEFTKRNYALIKADVAAHPAADNIFGLAQYQEKGIKQGAYIVSDGKAIIPAALVLDAATGIITITMTAGSTKVSDLKSLLGLSSEEFFTLVGINAAKGAVYCRARVNDTLDADTEISAENISTIFKMEGNAKFVPAFAGNAITLTLDDAKGNCGVIVSRKSTSGFTHSKCVLSAPTAPTWSADIALATYPIGNEMYLNGGDVNGLVEG